MYTDRAKRQVRTSPRVQWSRSRRPRYIHKKAFQFYEIGLGSAASVVLLIILLGLGVYYVRLMREQV